MEIDGVHVHPAVTLDVITEAVERYNTSLDNPGFCIACGEEAMGCEPDGRQYECEVCEKPCVYGAQELLFHFAI